MVCSGTNVNMLTEPGSRHLEGPQQQFHNGLLLIVGHLKRPDRHLGVDLHLLHAACHRRNGRYVAHVAPSLGTPYSLPLSSAVSDRSIA